MSNNPAASVKKSILLSLLVLGVAAAALWAIFRTEPKAQISGATKSTPMLVQTKPVEVGTFEPVIVATGTVRPGREVFLSSRVSGAVTQRSEQFSPGDFVDKGSILVQIDPTDYRIALSQRKSELAQIRTQLRLELGQQDIARREYEALFAQSDQELSSEDKELLLRKPQLTSMKEQVSVAESAVQKAEQDLARTLVRSPFDAQVLTRQVDVGSHVQPGMALGRLVGTERYWVEASIPSSLRRWLNFSEGSAAPCSEVHLRNDATWQEGVSRRGCLKRLIGALDEATRMARVLIEVDDPLLRKSVGGTSGPALMIGEFVEARMRARPLQNVARLERDLVRKGNTVWLAKEGKLEISPIRIVLSDAEYAYVDEGLTVGDVIVTSDLSRVRQGAPLRFEGAGQETSSSGSRESNHE